MSERRSTLQRASRELGVFGLFLLGAVVFTFPMALDLDRAVTDLADPLLDAWSLAWVAHQLPRAPLHLFDANRYYPELGTLAFTDPMIGLAILVAPVQIFGAPVAALNIAILFSIALSGYGAYRLTRYLSGSEAGGWVAGAVFAFNPFRLSHLSHAQLQTTGFIPLLYLCIHRYFDQGRALHAVGIGVFLWFISASSAYYGLFTWIVLGVALPYETWRTRAWQKPRRLLGLFLALTLSALAYLPLATPFMRLENDFGFKRPTARLERASARPQAYLRSGSHFHQSVGMLPPNPERTLFPGFVAVALGLLALLRTNRRSALYWLIGLFAFWASLGPQAGLYRFLLGVVPGLTGLRVPPRIAVYVLLAVAVVAGIGAGWMLKTLHGKKRFAAVALCALLPLAESFGGPVAYTRAPELPVVYAWLAERSGPTPIVELPLPAANRSEIHKNALYMFWSTSHFKPMANGYSAFIPPVYAEITEAMEAFPSEAGVATLRRLRFRYLILHRDLYLREQARAMEEAMRRQAGLREVFRTENETVFELVEN